MLLWRHDLGHSLTFKSRIGAVNTIKDYSVLGHVLRQKSRLHQQKKFRMWGWRPIDYGDIGAIGSLWRNFKVDTRRVQIVLWYLSAMRIPQRLIKFRARGSWKRRVLNFSVKTHSEEFAWNDYAPLDHKQANKWFAEKLWCGGLTTFQVVRKYRDSD